MRKLSLQEVKKIVEDTWGVIRNHRAMKSGDMWAAAALSNPINWAEKLGLEDEHSDDQVDRTEE